MSPGMPSETPIEEILLPVVDGAEPAGDDRVVAV